MGCSVSKNKHKSVAPMRYCIDPGNSGSTDQSNSSTENNATGDEALTDIGQFKPERAPRRPRGDGASGKAREAAGDVQTLLDKYGTGNKI